jgi:hypothetical protein
MDLTALINLIPGGSGAVDHLVSDVKDKLRPYVIGAGALLVGGFVLSLAAYIRSGQPAGKSLSGARTRRRSRR